MPLRTQLDPAIYQLADQPWSYQSMAGILKNWGYKPVGDHGPEHQLNLEGFLIWEKIGEKPEERRAFFVIANPRWRAHGVEEPVWPAAVIMRALRAQAVFHLFGSNDLHIEGYDVVPLSRKRPIKRSGR